MTEVDISELIGKEIDDIEVDNNAGEVKIYTSDGEFLLKPSRKVDNIDNIGIGGNTKGKITGIQYLKRYDEIDIGGDQRLYENHIITIDLGDLITYLIFNHEYKNKKNMTIEIYRLQF